jgi:hypothetical protein
MFRVGFEPIISVFIRVKTSPKLTYIYIYVYQVLPSIHIFQLNCAWISYLSRACYMCHPILIDITTLTLYGEEYKL